MNMKYLPTGNEMISIPKLNENTAGIEDVTFLHMGYKGLVELRGGMDMPLMEPFVEQDGQLVPLSGMEWDRLQFWVPRFAGLAGHIRVKGTILAPIGERGFLYHMELTNTGSIPHTIVCGLQGFWNSAWHCVNEDKRIEGTMHCFESPWNGSLIFDMRCGVPLFCFAPMPEDSSCVSTWEQSDAGICYRLAHSYILEPRQRQTVTVYWGFGMEEVSAATSAKEMLRQGYQHEKAQTLLWLRERTFWLKDDTLRQFYNTNLFFCMFFSTGTTLDTEELVLVTSRSPRYYVSAAYWDRDSLLWAFPAILDTDRDLAKSMLEYVFGRQRRNIGVHSRFIDGTVLEPGFELDELMAPVLSLERYVEITGDRSLLDEREVRRGLEEILQKLEKRRHPHTALYSTFLQPTDDEIVYPYLTYDNVLVWKGLTILAGLLGREELVQRAAQVNKAIWDNCVIEQNGKSYFAWSIDLDGHHDIYDEPPGSLQLLPYWGFCAAEDQVYRNTVDMIRSPEYRYSFAGKPFGEIGCPHASHPWLLSVANSLLCGRVEHSTGILKKAVMDNGIVCESIDETTGQCATGEAFATCAGFVCHALRTALEETADAK
ncbi:MAG: glycoside hydrolase family 125 protein [Oscillospiraceae bacterium]